MRAGVVRASRAKRAIRWRILRVIDEVLAAKRKGAVGKVGKRILLVAPNALMADYVLRVWECISEEPDLFAHLTRFRGVSESHSRACRQLGVRWISPTASQLSDWDLLILADHAPFSYIPSIPRVIAAHGVARSRLTREGSYYYDRQRIFWPDGQPVYDMMLEASDHAREWAVRAIPEYASRIRVVGALRVDELLAHDQGRDEMRANLGWSERRVIAVMSTWGSEALIPRVGERLLPVLAGLVRAGDHAVILTMHPNLWDERRSGTDQWQRLVEAYDNEHFRVLRPDEDWAPWLPLSDVAVTDHTSLCAAYSVLGRPLIPIDVPKQLIGEDTFAWWMLNECPCLVDPADLPRLLDLAESASVDHRRPAVVDFAGRARDQTRLVLLDVLNGSA